jgi:hypothetical protein
LFPDVLNHVGPTGFGFSGNGELLRIYDEQGAMVDTVHYDDTAPWPLTPDGMGPTLELINPGLDNALAQSWAASCEMHGTPGEQNCVFVSIPKTSPNRGFVTLKAQPNPMNTSSQIIINSEKPLFGGTLVVYNILGREVLRVSNITQNRVQINRGALPSGSYYVLFTDPDNNLRGNCKLIME